jgi:hypothetical protein
MYVDKKIANDVEIVQTFSRLNRMAPGKDEVFIIDFVNDPENVRRAFAMYDDGAQIDDVQDLNVVYEIKEQLDGQGLYERLTWKRSRKPVSRPSVTSRMLRSRSTRRSMPRPRADAAVQSTPEDAARSHCDLGGRIRQGAQPRR